MYRQAAAVLLVLLALPSLAAVTGTVMTSDGAPVAGARVSLYPVESSEARRMRLLSDSPQRAPLATAQTDTRGNWSLDSPKEAVADLAITAAGYTPIQRRVERDEEVGAIALFKSETKQGTIRAGGKPVAGVTVVLIYSGGAEYIVKTDDQGRYEAPDPKRARSITVIHPAWAIDDEAFLSASAPAALNRTLTAGTTITGRVLAADGTTPVAKATILVDSWPVGISGDDGTFTIARAPAKWGTVMAQSGSLMAVRTQGNEKSLTLKLAKPAMITGRITDARTKLPIAGAAVRASVRMARMTAESWGAVSDAKGNYAIPLPPGTYFVIATHPAYSVGPLDVSVAAGQTSAKDFSATPLARVSGVVMDEDRKPVAAASIIGEEVSDDRMMPPRITMRETITISGPDGRFSTRVDGDRDLRIRATRKGLPVANSETFRVASGERKSGIVVTIPSGIAVSGKVTDRDGKALSGVAVTAAEATAGPRGMVRQMIFVGGVQSEDDPVRTGSDGTFTIRLKEGTYDFSFRREGYATRLVRGQTVNASGTQAVEATLDPAVEITGRVVRNGAGVDGVMISTFSESGMGTTVVSAPDGSFTLSGLTPGEVRANFRKEGDFIQENRNLTAPARDVLVELPSGGRISGRVIDKQSRKPLSTFQAGVSMSRGGSGMVMMGPPQLRNFTNDDGTFTLENVPLGAVNLIASAPGYAQARMNLTLEEGKPITGVELELDPGTKIVGKVTGPDGSPLSGVNVRAVQTTRSGGAFGMMSSKQTVTDAQGEYTLEAVEPTDDTIEFSHPKYVGTRKEITVKGREVRVDVQLTSGQRVTGVVVTEAGAPVADAEVEAMAGAGTMRSARTDANGQFTFDSLAAARYRFTASKHGFTEARVEDVDISSGAPVRLVLRSGATLYGQVRGLTAEELQSTTVEVRGSDGAWSNANVDSSGNYRLEGAPTGTVRVSATVSRNFSTRKSSAPQVVTIAAGESQNVDLEFRSDTVIRGRVTRNQRPLANANITFAPKRGSSTQSSASSTTDEQGSYTISGLEPGEYSVFVVDMQRFSPYQTTYEVRGSATFDIDYTASNLRGRVVDAGTSDPINDARVQIRSASSDGFRGDRTAMTDVNGTFTLDAVAPGTYTVTADKAGFGNSVTEVTIGESAPQDLELRLSKNPGVTLKVVDARDGRSLNAIVYVFDQAGRFVADSGMRFGGAMDTAADVKLSLSAGSYIATVSAMGYAPVSVTLTSPGNQTVALSPGGKIVLRSSRGERQRVRLVDARGLMYPRTPNRSPAVDLPPSPAEIPLNNIAPGSYTVQVLTNNDTTVVRSIPVTVVEGGSIDVDV